MAVSKIWAVKSRLDKVLDYAANPDKTGFTEDELKDVIDYAKNFDKTDGEKFVTGINCNPRIAYTQFQNTKKRFNKTDGILAYHGYMSYAKGEITPQKAHDIGVEYAKRVWGDKYEVIVTTHLNTDCYHNHFVVNSVSFVDGKRCREKTWFILRHEIDKICKEHNLSVVENGIRNSAPQYLTAKEQAGMPTRYNLAKEALDVAIENSKSIKELEYNLKKLGYSCNFNVNHKYWTVTPKGYDRPIRTYRLGEKYSRENILNAVLENNRLVKYKPFVQGQGQYKLSTRGTRLRKVKGLRGLYFYYLYKLGYLPKNKPRNTSRVHYLLRKDLMKLDKLSNEARLLEQYGINTVGELFSYKSKAEKEIEILTENRKQLRNKLKRKNCSNLNEVKEDISEIGKRLKEIRKEILLIDDIAERSNEIEEKLEQAEIDEQKKLRKEEKYRE